MCLYAADRAGVKIMAVFILVILIMLSAYFSATETAFSTCNKTRLRSLADDGNGKAALVLSLAEQYDRLLSTILIGNNIVNITSSSLATVLFVHMLGDIGATVSTAVITVVVLIFGEITPKSIAKDRPESFAMFSAPFIRVLMVLLSPLNAAFSLWKRLINRLFRPADSSAMSQEELKILVEEARKEGGIDENESDLLHNALTFTDRETRDILTHRVDLTAVEVNESKTEIAAVFAQSRYSRLPVYEEDVDHIIGVLHQKDFYTPTGITEKSVREAMVRPVFVLETERIGSLLQTMQKEKTHLAVVLDELGGTAGIVSMEDVLEELVGDIWDEHDEITEPIRPVGESMWQVDGDTPLLDFLEETGCPAPDSDSVTISGWMAELLAKIPDTGDRCRWKNWEFTIDETENHRVIRISACRLSDEGSDAPADGETISDKKPVKSAK